MSGCIIGRKKLFYSFGGFLVFHLGIAALLFETIRNFQRRFRIRGRLPLLSRHIVASLLHLKKALTDHAIGNLQRFKKQGGDAYEVSCLFSYSSKRKCCDCRKLIRDEFFSHIIFMFNGKKVLALIPARGGSKGVPKKNIKLLAGKPLIAWSIEAARQSKYIDRVVVSTDSEEIAEVARQCGAEVPFLRPANLAEDLTPDTPVFAHCLDWLREHEDYELDILVHLRPTGPLRTAAEIDEAIEILEKFPEADSVRSVEEPPKPPFKMWKVNGEYMIPFVYDMPGLKDFHTAPRQLLPKVYQTTADIGVVRRNTVREKNSVIGEKVLPYFLKRPTVDIDSNFDFYVAELLMKMRLQN